MYSIDDLTALRPEARRTRGSADALLRGVSNRERGKSLRAVEALFDKFSTHINWPRLRIPHGSLCTRFCWLPEGGASGPIRTDIDFILHPRLARQPEFSALLTSISPTNSRYARLHLVALLILRDWDNQDYWSIQNAQPIFDSLQEKALRRAALAKADRKRIAQDLNLKRIKRRAELATRVKRVGKGLLDSSRSRAECLSLLRERIPASDLDNYPSSKTLTRLFDEIFPTAAGDILDKR